MKSQWKTLSNFCHSLKIQSEIYRPEHEDEMAALLAQITKTSPLPYGHCLSYSDCHLWHHGKMLDTRRLNHILSFDRETGIVICQPAVTFADLMRLDPNWTPPVIPGTIHATLAGGIANDVHGKNNPRHGNLGHHILWFDLLIGTKTIHCSPEESSDLFYATIAGLGLTGVIKRVALQMTQHSGLLSTKTERFTSLDALGDQMIAQSTQVDYQAAWLHSTKIGKAVLKTAVYKNDHSTCSNSNFECLSKNKLHTIPKLPFSLIHHATMQVFNTAYYRFHSVKTTLTPLWQFNNPLDQIKNWPNLYGKKGFMQFQAVFDAKDMPDLVFKLFKIIETNQTFASLVVLKYFTQRGLGLLSFTGPGFTIAIDLPYSLNAKKAVSEMNQFILSVTGKVYLAKDQHLDAATFKAMYPNYSLFSEVRKRYDCNSHSDLAKRLGLNQ